jgi:hypothetical protein
MPRTRSRVAVSQKAKLYLVVPGQGSAASQIICQVINFLNTAIAAVPLVFCIACSEPRDPRRTNFEIRGKDGVAKYDPKTGRLQRIDADTNKNGHIETFSYWDATRIIRIEIDRDEDGKIDRWEHYDDANTLRRIGSSSRDDEVEDTWTYPDAAGLLERVESDTDRDGILDKREIYVPHPSKPGGRVLSVVELGLNQAGNPSRRLYYRPDGSFDRSETSRP